jgi:tetratricopeptide (TPR) repeat protein
VVKAQAYFGLARIAGIQNQKDESLQLFETALESSPDAQVKGWTHYYLGRLYELASEPDRALGHFQSAIATEGISPKARQLAEQALAEASKKRQ